ncbi:MAG: DMT family transporter [Myxococcota bacterium]
MSTLDAWLGFEPHTPPAQRLKVAAVLLAAVAGVSSSGVLVRGMHADPLAIAAWRTLGAALILAPTARAGLGVLSRRDWLALGLAGVALALHFWTWFASLGTTTILRSTVLVCTVPVWTAAAEWLWAGVRPRLGWWIGLGIALPGLGLLAGTGGRATLAGDALALAAAALWAGYFLVGRELRQRVSAGPMMALVCAAAAAVLFPLAAAGGVALTGYPGGTWVRIGLAILGPQLVGHLGFVYAVRWVSAATVSVVTLLEPVVATVLAAAILGEVPGPYAVLGAAIVSIGIGIAVRAPDRSGG